MTSLTQALAGWAARLLSVEQADQQRDAFLAQAVDMADFECRQRQFER